MAQNYKNNKSSKRSTNKRVDDKSTKFESELDSNIRKNRAKCASRENDASWYMGAGTIANTAANISYFLPTGSPCKLSPFANGNESIPGVLTLDLTYGPGSNFGGNVSGVNLAMRKIYSYIRHVNAGHANYDPVDYMIYLLGVDSAYATYAYFVRAYGVAMQYSSTNKYTPSVLLKAMGFSDDITNPNCILNNMRDFKYMIDRFAQQLGTFAVPANMPIFRRHAWLFSNYFIDKPSTKAQFYLFKPSHYYVYDEVTQLGQLTWTEMPENITILQVEQIINDIISALLSSEDVGIMAGDTLKAYSSDQLLHVSAIDDNFELKPLYSEEVLSQIHNATICGRVYTTGMTGQNVTQDVTTGNIIWSPQVSQNYGPAGSGSQEVYIPTFRFMNDGDIPIDMYKDNVSVEDTMVATRLVVPKGSSITSIDSTHYRYAPMYFGTEFVNRMVMYIFHDNNGTWETQIIGNTMPWAGTNLPTFWGALSQFDFAPRQIMCYLAAGSSGPNFTETAAIWETTNTTLVSRETMKRINEAAILSEWDVPEMTFTS